jgi:hypothetical protein
MHNFQGSNLAEVLDARNLFGDATFFGGVQYFLLPNLALILNCAKLSFGAAFWWPHFSWCAGFILVDSVTFSFVRRFSFGRCF